jgi:hypothetical protein
VLAPQRTKSPKNAVENAQSTPPNCDPLDLRGTELHECEDYSDHLPPFVKITATNHYRFAKLLARTLKES